MKVTLVSSLVGHGKILHDSGTGIVLLLSKNQKVESVIVLSWKRSSLEQVAWPGKVLVKELYSELFPFSVIKILIMAIFEKSDTILFNLMPTAYGRSNISNFIGLISPIILRLFFKKKVIVLSHNSTYINDYRSLGYKGFLNYFKAKFVKIIEFFLFNNVRTFMLSKEYVNTIKQKFPTAAVGYLDLPFFQVIAPIYINDLQNHDKIFVEKGRIPRILLFGSWGPQKDPLNILLALRELRKSGRNFDLTVAGGINKHFLDLENHYQNLFKNFKDVIDNLKGYVEEKDIIKLFTSADLVVNSYVVPGGFSSVLALGMFFERFIVMSDFPEYREQSNKYDRIIFSTASELENSIKTYLDRIHPTEPMRIEIPISSRIESMESSLFTCVSE